MDKTPPNWELYRSFLAVLEEGSLSAAARRLRSTQPTIGRQIATLEQNLNVALFTRSRHGLNPTQTALELAPYVHTMAAATANLERITTGEANAEQGTIRLAASDVMGVEILPAILAGFRQRYPKIALELVLSNRPEDLLRRDADIAVRMFRPEQEALIAKSVGAIKIGLYTHRDYAEKFGLPENWMALSRHALIGFDKIPFPSSKNSSSITLPTREDFSFRCDNDLGQLAALRAGIGIGGCQTGIARRNPALIPVLHDAFSVALDTWLVMHEDLRSSPRIKLLFDHLSAALTHYVASCR
jgi:DNA-binding transcriptional LysR family regulator